MPRLRDDTAVDAAAVLRITSAQARQYAAGAAAERSLEEADLAPLDPAPAKRRPYAATPSSPPPLAATGARPNMSGKQADEHRDRFQQIVRSDRGLMDLLARLREIDLPQWRLVAGCLYQTVWNVLTGRPRGTGIRDYDLIYFDLSDLSYEAEDRVIRRVAAATASGIGPVEVRNQARVHLWFEARFGMPYSPLSSADAALLRYASVVHAVGVRLEADGRLDIVAPFGLEDLFGMVIRPNPALDNAASHMGKALRAQAIWPEVTIVPWDTGVAAKDGLCLRSGTSPRPTGP